MIKEVKTDFLLELFEVFPDKAEQIISDITEKFSSELVSVNEDEKTDLIILKISENDLLRQKISLIIDSKRFVESLDNQNIISVYNDKNKVLNSNKWFLESYFPQNSDEEQIDEIEKLINDIEKNIQYIGNVNFQVSELISRFKNLLMRLSMIPQDKIIHSLKSELESKLNIFISFQKNLFQNFSSNIEKIKIMEERLKILNMDIENKKTNQEIKLFIENFKNILEQQKKINDSLNSFEVIPSIKILEYKNLINNFSTLFLSYSSIKNYLMTTEKVDLQTVLSNEINTINNTFFENIKLFIEKSKTSFEKVLVNVKDKEKIMVFNNKVLNSNLNLDKESLEIIQSMLKVLY